MERVFRGERAGQAAVGLSAGVRARERVCVGVCVSVCVCVCTERQKEREREMQRETTVFFSFLRYSLARLSLSLSLSLPPSTSHLSHASPLTRGRTTAQTVCLSIPLAFLFSVPSAFLRCFLSPSLFSLLSRPSPHTHQHVHVGAGERDHAGVELLVLAVGVVDDARRRHGRRAHQRQHPPRQKEVHRCSGQQRRKKRWGVCGRECV